MFVGMGTVFVFLCLLVMATSLMSRLVIHLAGAPAAEAEPQADEAEEIAAISAAIALHRRRR